jgi:hypothetical protein
VAPPVLPPAPAVSASADGGRGSELLLLLLLLLRPMHGWRPWGHCLIDWGWQVGKGCWVYPWPHGMHHLLLAAEGRQDQGSGRVVPLVLLPPRQALLLLHGTLQQHSNG